LSAKNLRRRRLTVVLSALVAVACAGAAYALGPARGAGSDPPASTVAAGVLSPRRAPKVLQTLVAETRLASRVQAIMRSLSPTSCIVVRADESTLLSVKPNQLLTPASALKLTTAAAFLEKLGGTERFETSVAHRETDSSGTVTFLSLVGDGDPLLATQGYVETRKHPPIPFTDFTQLARKIRNAGVRHVTDGIVVADDRFDAERRVPSWSAGYTATGDVGPIGALAVNDGFSAFTPRLVAATDPAIAAGEQLRRELTALGVVVDGAVRRGTRDARSIDVVSIASAPFAEVVGEMLRESDNNTAESLLKYLPGGATAATRAEGVAERAVLLKRLGIDPKGVQAIDGSGLDRSDRASCAALIGTLTTKPGGYDLEDMLAVAGRTGTLDDRFTTSPLAGRLRAKTGSLTGVTALVGIADPKATTKLRFAFVSNGAFSDEGGKALQDRLVAALATFPEAPDASEMAP
jgi:D-alanyl-D-alanine carboxypeptidase/D-alanyl-D-alanine-endopeptidase (penicillin-binding protein 4)